MKYIFTLFGMFLIFNLFSQDLNLEKIETTKEKLNKTKAKISYPIELKFGYGALLSLNNDRIKGSFYPDTTFSQLMLYFDTINNMNYYTSYNFGARKRFGNFRLGLNLKYSYLNNYHMNPYKDYYWTIDGVTLLTKDFENNELSQKTNFWVLNLTSDYIFLETKKIQMAVGLSAGGLNFTDVTKYTSSSIHYNYSYGNIQEELTLNSVDTVSQDYRRENQNFSLNLIPSFSLGYKFSNLIKAELSAFYIFQLSNDIKTSGTNNFTTNGIQNSYDLSNGNSKISFQNPSKIGLNLNLIFCLGKEKNN